MRTSRPVSAAASLHNSQSNSLKDLPQLPNSSSIATQPIQSDVSHHDTTRPEAAKTETLATESSETANTTTTTSTRTVNKDLQHNEDSPKQNTTAVDNLSLNVLQNDSIKTASSPTPSVVSQSSTPPTDVFHRKKTTAARASRSSSKMNATTTHKNSKGPASTVSSSSATSSSSTGKSSHGTTSTTATTTTTSNTSRSRSATASSVLTVSGTSVSGLEGVDSAIPKPLIKAVKASKSLKKNLASQESSQSITHPTTDADTIHTSPAANMTTSASNSTMTAVKAAGGAVSGTHSRVASTVKGGTTVPHLQSQSQSRSHSRTSSAASKHSAHPRPPSASASTTSASASAVSSSSSSSSSAATAATGGSLRKARLTKPKQGSSQSSSVSSSSQRLQLPLQPPSQSSQPLPHSSQPSSAHVGEAASADIPLAGASAVEPHQSQPPSQPPQPQTHQETPQAPHQTQTHSRHASNTSMASSRSTASSARSRRRHTLSTHGSSHALHHPSHTNDHHQQQPQQQQHLQEQHQQQYQHPGDGNDANGGAPQRELPLAAAPEATADQPTAQHHHDNTNDTNDMAIHSNAAPDIPSSSSSRPPPPPSSEHDTPTHTADSTDIARSRQLSTASSHSSASSARSRRRRDKQARDDAPHDHDDQQQQAPSPTHATPRNATPTRRSTAVAQDAIPDRSHAADTQTDARHRQDSTTQPSQQQQPPLSDAEAEQKTEPKTDTIETRHIPPQNDNKDHSNISTTENPVPEDPIIETTPQTVNAIIPPEKTVSSYANEYDDEAFEVHDTMTGHDDNDVTTRGFEIDTHVSENHNDAIVQETYTNEYNNEFNMDEKNTRGNLGTVDAYGEFSEPIHDDTIMQEEHGGDDITTLHPSQNEQSYQDQNQVEEDVFPVMESNIRDLEHDMSYYESDFEDGVVGDEAHHDDYPEPVQEMPHEEKGYMDEEFCNEVEDTEQRHRGEKNKEGVSSQRPSRYSSKQNLERGSSTTSQQRPRSSKGSSGRSSAHHDHRDLHTSSSRHVSRHTSSVFLNQEDDDPFQHAVLSGGKQETRGRRGDKSCERPPWRPNSLLNSPGWTYVPPKPRNQSTTRSLSPQHRKHRSRSLSKPVEHKKPFSAPTGTKLHQTYFAKVKEECINKFVTERSISSSRCREKSRSLSVDPTRSRSLKTAKVDKLERWPRAMPGTRTFSNLPVDKSRESRSKTRGGIDGYEKYIPLAERTRNEMKFLAKSRQRTRRNWTSRASRFVSQVHQPAWAEPLRPPKIKPKEPHPKSVARSLDLQADSLQNSDAELKLRLDHIKKLTEAYGCTETVDHVFALTKLSRFWLSRGEFKEALRSAIVARTTARALITADQTKLLDRLRTDDCKVPGGNGKLTMHQKIKNKQYDVVEAPMEDIEKAIKLEKQIDVLISSIVDARVRQFGISKKHSVSSEETNQSVTDGDGRAEEEVNRNDPDDHDDVSSNHETREINQPQTHLMTKVDAPVQSNGKIVSTSEKQAIEESPEVQPPIVNSKSRDDIDSNFKNISEKTDVIDKTRTLLEESKSSSDTKDKNNHDDDFQEHVSPVEEHIGAFFDEEFDFCHKEPMLLGDSGMEQRSFWDLN